MTEKSRNILEARKVMEGDDITRSCGGGGFYSGTVPMAGVQLIAYGSNAIFLSKKNIYKLLNLVLKGAPNTTIEIEEYPEEKAEEQPK